MSDQYQYQIPPEENRHDFIRSRVFVERDRVANTSCTSFPGAWSGYDDSWDFEKWKQQYQFIVQCLSKSYIEFDMIGVHSSIANTIRRILLSEIPTIAFEHAYFLKNTGVLVDEILAHRLGLIPIKVDPTKLVDRSAEDGPTDLNTLVYQLDVKCHADPTVSKNAPNKQRLINHHVLSGQLEWVPQGNQLTTFAGDSAPQIPYKDIVITKLNEGEELSVLLHAYRGIGSDHAKFSPVGTASYRLLPEIHLLRPIIGDEAYKFQQCFPKGVIDVDNDVKSGKPIARVSNARLDTVSRECLRHPEFENAVTLSRKRDHFIFRVESVGVLEPQVLLSDAFRVLKEKAVDLKKCLNALSTEQ